MMTPQLDPKLFLASKPAVGPVSSAVQTGMKSASPLNIGPVSNKDMPPPQPKAASPNPLASAFATFAKGFAPQQTAAVDERYKADGMERNKKALTWLQQTAQLPAEQRAAFTLSRAQDIARDTGQSYEAVVASARDPNGFSDDSIKQGIAAFSAQLGIAPEAPQGPLEINNQLVDPSTGKVMGDYRTPEKSKPMSVNNRLINPETGEVIGDYSDAPMPKTYNTGQAIVSIDPVTNKPTVLYRDPQQQGGAIGGFQTLSPQEAEARGYPKGTVVQVDNRGAEYVRSRPSTAQTGQPTEGERNAGMHVTVALNGLQKLTDMEGGGYNRAGLGEQMSTLFGENEKLYDQSAAEFIDGYLRAMTGAAATASEIDTYRKQWFPQFGDTPAVVQQKAAGRLNALRGMKSKAGRAWNQSWDGVIQQLEQQVGPAASNIAPPSASPSAEDDNADDEEFFDTLAAQFMEMGDGPPPGVDPALWDVMDEEDKAAFR